MNMIIPTVGRVVYFRPGNGMRAMMHVRDDQPMRADIIYVWNDRRVSLNVDDHEGHRHFIPSIQLLQDGDTPPKDGSYAYWMPYQKAVAKGEIAPTMHAVGAKPTIEELEKILNSEEQTAVHINPDGSITTDAMGTLGDGSLRPGNRPQK